MTLQVRECAVLAMLHTSLTTAEVSDGGKGCTFTPTLCIRIYCGTFPCDLQLDCDIHKYKVQVISLLSSLENAAKFECLKVHLAQAGEPAQQQSICNSVQIPKWLKNENVIET